MSSSTKWHINWDTGEPGRCRADFSNPRSTGCKFNQSSSEHYNSLEEATAAYEHKMQSAVDVFSTVSAHGELVEQFRSRLSGDLGLQDLISIGGEIGDKVFERAGLNPDASEYSKEELDNFSNSLSAYLKEIQGEPVNVEVNFTGSKAAYLKECFSVLPTSVQALLNGKTIIASKLRYDSGRDGEFSAFVNSKRPSDTDSISHALVADDVKAGDMVVSSEVTSSYQQFVNDGLTGFQCLRVVKPKGEGIKPGDHFVTLLKATPSHLLDSSELEKIGELKDLGILNERYLVVAGREQELRQMFPRLSDYVEANLLVDKYYVSTDNKKPNKNYKSTGDKEVPLTFPSGETVNVKGAVYRHVENSIAPNTYEIKTKGDLGAKSTALHEFSHAIQNTVKVPGEDTLFNLHTKDSKAAMNKGLGVKVFDVFPDSYMGHNSGGELFPEATAAVFYPGELDNDYLFNREHPLKKEIRDWVIGAWAKIVVDSMK